MRNPLAVVTVLFCGAAASYAQSTFGVVLGTVKDATGGVVRQASVRLTNLGENIARETTTSETGAYEFQNTKPGLYSVKVTHAGFRTFTAQDLTLVARQTLRVDATLQLGEVSEIVEVQAAAGVIATDSPAISESLNAQNVLNLPGNVRAGGNTTPYNLIATVPGVQPDNGNGYSIQGGLPAQTETSVDGVSVTNVTGNSPNRNLFPSVESIAEIKVQGVGNTAEYGAPGDIATISKSGTNAFHGALFWYHQNRALDARSFGQTALPAKIGNTFGGAVGGPVLLPKVYNGRNRTFFHFAWESLRFPRQSTIQNSVPTQAMRDGDFNQEGVVVRDPFTAAPFPGDRIPAASFNAVAKAVIPFYPLSNVGPGIKSATANYITNRKADIRSNQWDVRMDHQFSPKHAIFGRYTSKDNPSTSPNSLLLPSDTGYNDHRQAVVSYTWTIRPNLLNEFRGGISFAPSGATFPFDGLAFTNSLNLKNIQRDIYFNALPNFAISQLTAFAKGRPGQGASWNTQFIDNVTWIRGRHTIKAGFDLRRLRAETNLGFTTGDNYGDYNFSGNLTGAPWGDFLLGVPASTQIAVVVSDNDGRAVHYKSFVQDTFHVSPKLTLDSAYAGSFIRATATRDSTPPISIAPYLVRAKSSSPPIRRR